MSAVHKKDKTAEGRRRKEVALELHESPNAVSLLLVRRHFLELVLLGRNITLDDLRDVIPDNMPPMSLGAVPNVLSRVGAISRLGFKESSRAVAHGRLMSVWTLQSAAAAHRWLADHPAPVRQSAPVVQRTLFDGGEE